VPLENIKIVVVFLRKESRAYNRIFIASHKISLHTGFAGSPLLLKDYHLLLENEWNALNKSAINNRITAIQWPLHVNISSVNTRKASNIICVHHIHPLLEICAP
jgi:hypothetical protein